mgnify:FL=1
MKSKKRGLLSVIFITLLFLIANAQAISSNIKDSYEKKETIIGELSGSILAPISKSQVNLVRDGHIDVAFDYDVKQLGSKYYVWLTAPQNEGNYTLIISNIVTNEQGFQTQVNYQKNFIVTSNSTDYSIKPGFISVSQDFFITATLYSETEKTINIDFPSSRSVNLQQGDNRIDFSIKDVVGTQLKTINFGKYAVPAYILGKAINNSVNQTGLNQTINQTNPANATLNGTNPGNWTGNQTINATNFSNNLINASFKIVPQSIKSTILITENPSYPFKIFNFDNSSVGITLNYDKNIFVIVPDINLSIEPNSSIQLNLSLKNNTGVMVRDAIVITSGKKSEYLLIEFNFTKKSEDVSTSYLSGNSSSSESLLYCSEIPGAKLCTASGEVCNGKVISSLESGICCQGTCKTESSSSKAWIGYLIIAIVIMVLLVIYLKYKKTKSPANPMASLGKTSGMPPGLPPRMPPRGIGIPGMKKI